MGRPKLIQDDELLAVARKVFVEKGIAASTRQIARRAGVSEGIIYQRFPTKADLFFAAMVPPAVDLEAMLAKPIGGLDGLQRIALGMTNYFRSLIPILLPLMTHPSFDFEKFARRHPDSPLSRLRLGLVEFLETQRKLGAVEAKHVRPAALTLFAALHSLAVFEKLGAHGGKFGDATVRAMVLALWRGLEPRRKWKS